MSKYQPYADLSDSPVLSAYAQQTINQLDPTLYDDIYEMLKQVSPSKLVTIGNPAITAPASWWGDWFGLNLTAEDIAELKEIDL
ncbi:hypothetical protein KXR35_000547 [Escherichia coli]|uniref:hypothetical protein n=1 Tax=Enterobacter TaxID=547 RepID=UPI00105F9E6D|nr:MULTISPECIES: hypothetical protein [Enterobacter]EHT7738851.1 hypothetical protein [Escherichia coli]MEB7317524.1 hypothetical protein [Escherichia coli]TDP25215.1 hypothetical protein DFO52_1011005 [Enterobacter sp. AG326]